jgi:Cu2+-exporting ATPase
VFDKTGTLTLGQLSLVKTITHADLDADACLQLAASLEKHSEHALAKAFLNAQGSRPVQLAAEVKNVPGQGVEGIVAGLKLRLGNVKLNQAFAANLVEQDLSGATVVWLSDETRLLATFVLADQARPEAQALIQKLKQQGLHVSILSGDSVESVSHFAKLIGMDDWKAACSPEDKLAHIHALQSQGAVVAMVGDGINDAPVLAAAQVSMAMGSGTQMARASGDVVLLTEHLLEIEHALVTSRFGISVIRQNFIWAIAYNLVALPFAAMGLLSPWMAAIGMSVSSLIVVLNALRLK